MAGRSAPTQLGTRTSPVRHPSGGHVRDEPPKSAWPLSRGWTLLLIGLVILFALLRGVYALAADSAEPSIMLTERVAVVGVTGRPQLTEADRTILTAHLDSAQVGSVAARGRYLPDCAAAGWTTLGAGRRAAVGGLCDPVIANRVVTDWAARQAAAAARNGDAQLGTLANSVPGCVAAVGPGAGLAAAGPDGTIAVYSTPQQFMDGGMDLSCPVTLIDAGELSDQIIAGLATNDSVTLVVTGVTGRRRVTVRVLSGRAQYRRNRRSAGGDGCTLRRRTDRISGSRDPRRRAWVGDGRWSDRGPPEPHQADLDLVDRVGGIHDAHRRSVLAAQRVARNRGQHCDDRLDRDLDRFSAAVGAIHTGPSRDHRRRSHCGGVHDRRSSRWSAAARIAAELPADLRPALVRLRQRHLRFVRSCRADPRRLRGASLHPCRSTKGCRSGRRRHRHRDRDLRGLANHGQRFRGRDRVEPCRSVACFGDIGRPHHLAEAADDRRICRGGGGADLSAGLGPRS